MISLELLGHDICFPRSFKMSCNDRGVESGVERRKLIFFQIVGFTYTHRIHVWYVYQHLVDVYGKCRSYMDPMGYRFCWLYRLSFHMEVGAILKRLFSENRSSIWCGQQMKPVYCNVKNSMSGFLITCN